MKTLDELIYYCGEKNPGGAIMLTGEWGCGKTYLVETELKEKLQGTNILIRISLFGLQNVDALHTTVKKKWLEQCIYFYRKVDKHKKAFGFGRELIDKTGNVANHWIPYVKGIKDAVLSINLIDYISISPVIECDGKEKVVVLVFDDLERTKLDKIDILGAINEYCENQNFHVIIIANEEKVDQSRSDSTETKTGNSRNGASKEKLQNLVYDHDANAEYLRYSEIKEKIICSTIKYQPEYDEIIQKVLEDGKWDVEYKRFLIENKERIKAAFGADEKQSEQPDGKRIDEQLASKPKNIRSLKCALNDFYRVYTHIDSIPEKADYLYSFIAFEQLVRSGLIEKSECYGYLIADAKIKKYYPGYRDSYMFQTAKDWLCVGEWDEEQIREEVKYKVAQHLRKKPVDILKSTMMFDVDDKDLQDGFDDYLSECYSGKLSLDEYVNFITYSIISR